MRLVDMEMRMPEMTLNLMRIEDTDMCEFAEKGLGSENHRTRLVSITELFKIFLLMHNPTNRQY